MMSLKKRQSPVLIHAYLQVKVYFRFFDHTSKRCGGVLSGCEAEITSISGAVVHHLSLANEVKPGKDKYEWISRHHCFEKDCCLYLDHLKEEAKEMHHTAPPKVSF